MIFNDPAMIAEVTAVFWRYEHALLTNDMAVLDELFVARADTIRYGASDIQYGIDEIRAWRALQGKFDRTLEGLVIVTYGTDAASAQTLFHRPDRPDELGRQTQVWVKMEGGWKVAAAHVSMLSKAKYAGAVNSV